MRRVRAGVPRALAMLAVLVVVSAQAGTPEASPASPALSCTGDWTTISSANPAAAGNTLSGVWSATATNAWAVGWSENGKSLVEHYAGSWKAVPVPQVGTNDELKDVSGSSAANIWAVGQYTAQGAHVLTVHWNGTSWKRVATPNLSGGPRLEGVSSGTSRPTWAVGYQAVHLASQWGTVILRLQNGKWARVASPNPNPWSNQLSAVKSVSNTLGWAVGASRDDDLDDHPLIEQWNGTKWTAITDPAVVGIRGALSGVATPTPTTMVAVGWGSGGPMIVYFDGSNWSVSYPAPTSGNLSAIASDGVGGAWAVGIDSPSDNEQDTMIDSGTGNSYTRVTNPDPPGDYNALLGVTSRQGVTWAVGLKDGGVHTLIEYHC